LVLLTVLFQQKTCHFCIYMPCKKLVYCVIFLGETTWSRACFACITTTVSPVEILHTAFLQTEGFGAADLQMVYDSVV